jgi:hypothetical protein
MKESIETISDSVSRSAWLQDWPLPTRVYLAESREQRPLRPSCVNPVVGQDPIIVYQGSALRHCERYRVLITRIK